MCVCMWVSVFVCVCVCVYTPVGREAVGEDGAKVGISYPSRVYVRDNGELRFRRILWEPTHEVRT